MGVLVSGFFDPIGLSGVFECNNDFTKKSRLAATFIRVNVAIAMIVLPVNCALVLRGLGYFG